jgi:UDP-N-acetylglucosamine 1-carboxyvinyltransferase
LGNHGVDAMIAGKRPPVTTPTRAAQSISAETCCVDTTAPYDLAQDAGKLLGGGAPCQSRMGEAKVSCLAAALAGTRPVDLLILALEKLGAKSRLKWIASLLHARQRVCAWRDRFPESDSWRHTYRDHGGIAGQRPTNH